MKSKNPVNFQGIIEKKTAKNKNKTKIKRCVTGVAKNYSSIQQTKTRKQNKQNKTHLQQYYILKNYRETAVLIGNCVDFLSVYFRKIQPGFL
jgi:hypothetical protein